MAFPNKSKPGDWPPTAPTEQSHQPLNLIFATKQLAMGDNTYNVKISGTGWFQKEVVQIEFKPTAPYAGQCDLTDLVLLSQKGSLIEETFRAAARREDKVGEAVGNFIAARNQLNAVVRQQAQSATENAAALASAVATKAFGQTMPGHLSLPDELGRTLSMVVTDVETIHITSTGELSFYLKFHRGDVRTLDTVRVGVVGGVLCVLDETDL